MGKIKTTDAERQKIVADYINNQNYSETARLHNLSVNSVKSIILREKDVANKLKEKKEETTNDMMQFLVSQYSDKQRVLKKLLKAIEIKSDDADINTLKELATAYGIIMDKELKLIEMQRGNGSREDLMKVEDLLTRLKQEAYK